MLSVKRMQVCQRFSLTKGGRGSVVLDCHQREQGEVVEEKSDGELRCDAMLDCTAVEADIDIAKAGYIE